MLLKFARKTYSQHICNHSQHICQLQAILIVCKAFVVVVRRLKRFASIHIDISVKCRTNVDNEYKFEKNKVIGQRLADIIHRETPAMCIVQINYPCVVFLFHSQQVCKIRKGIHKHS